MAVQPIRDKKLIEDIKQYLKIKNPRNYFLFVFSINTGLRIGDTLQLKVKDVAEKDLLKFRESKTDKTKRIRISPALKLEILTYCKDKDPEAFLFPSRKGNKPISTVQAYRILQDVAEWFEIDELGCHSLRKTYGYHFYQKTKDVAMLQELFNHSAPSITLIYIGINQEMIDQATYDFSL
jgi:integrase